MSLVNAFDWSLNKKNRLFFLKKKEEKSRNQHCLNFIRIMFSYEGNVLMDVTEGKKIIIIISSIFVAFTTWNGSNFSHDRLTLSRMQSWSSDLSRPYANDLFANRIQTAIVFNRMIKKYTCVRCAWQREEIPFKFAKQTNNVQCCYEINLKASYHSQN